MKPFRMQFEENWYRPSLNTMTAILLPAAWLFGVISAARRFCYRQQLFKSFRFPVPVMVVGNITVGGTGKTPCVIELAKYFTAKGLKPGIVSRGYGGKGQRGPLVVTMSTSTKIVGDEAVLLARRSQCPVVICADRVAAVQALLQHYPECNLVISDDGLQHYRLARDIEIAIVDGVRNFGNGCLLPAGPLREPISRLETVNFVIVNGGARLNATTMTVEPLHWISLADPNKRLPTSSLPAQRVHAVAGIGNPDQFFKMLRVQGYNVIEHAFPDHYQFAAEDLKFDDHLPILMTGKDAVKCEAFADQRMWCLDITARFDHQFLEELTQQLQGAMSLCTDPQAHLS